MAQLIWKAAREQARRLRDRYQIVSTSLDALERLANNLGIAVAFLPLREGVSGMIVKYPGQGAGIYIDSREPIVRQKFTLAHEIGHYMERSTVARDEEYSFTDARSTSHYDLHEFYADEFAGELLMPEEQMKELGDQATNAIDVAHKFGVSIAAAQKRIDRLAKTSGAESE